MTDVFARGGDVPGESSRQKKSFSMASVVAMP